MGFLSFCVAFCELLRTSLSLFAVNRRWRPAYSAATEDGTRASLRATIEAFLGAGDALFFLFYVAFLLGILYYGLMLVRTTGFDGLVGRLFLVWSILSVHALIDAVVGREILGHYFDWVGRYFLPVARAVVGVWLW